MVNARSQVVAGMILLAAAARLIPHPWNITPIGATALFGGANFRDRRLAFALPLAALFLSDLVIGPHRLMPFVYAAFAMIVGLGFWLRERRSAGRMAAAVFGGSVLFYLVTNFGVWAVGGWYPKSIGGLVDCYLAGLPYLRNTLVGDTLYTAVLFGGFALAERHIPALAEAGSSAPDRGLTS